MLGFLRFGLLILFICCAKAGPKYDCIPKIWLFSNIYIPIYKPMIHPFLFTELYVGDSGYIQQKWKCKQKEQSK